MKIKKKLNIIAISVFMLMITCINVSYAVEKPTYKDYIRSQYSKNLSDAEVESIIKFEDLLKSIREFPNKIYKPDPSDLDEDETEKDGTKKKDDYKALYRTFYGNYPAHYVGVLNFRRDNFLATLYSLRDINDKNNMQPLIVSNKNNRNFKKIGFDTSTWSKKDKGLSALEVIKWTIYQFEPMKLFKKLQDPTLVKALYEGKIADLVSIDESNTYVSRLSSSNKELINMKPGDILLYVEDDGTVSDYGIFIGKDNEGDYYGLSFHKLITNINVKIDYKDYDYFTNVVALSYINSTKIYPQEINGVVNLISGTKYNYIVKMKFLNN